jgi:flagellar biosynthesis protein FliR
MIVAFPIQIVIGLIFFGITLNIILRFVENYLGGMGVLLIDTMTGLKG